MALSVARASKGSVPPQLQRAGHSSAVYKGQVIVFAGRVADTFFSDLWSCNPATGEWHCLCARAPFPARANHTSTVVGDALWVVGGSSLADVYADAHVFDLREHTWSTPQLRGSTQLLQRTAHGACLHPLNAHSILLFAGYGSPAGAASQLQWLSDLVLLDTRRLDVSPLQTTGLAPEARGYHSFTAFGQGRCVAIGGRSHHNRLCEDGAMVAVYDAAARRWLQPAVRSGQCKARSSHKAVALDDDSVLVFGGSNTGGRLADFHCLRLEAGAGATAAWQDWTPEVAAAAGSAGLPAGRAAHCMELVGSSVLIVGGYGGNGKAYVADMWRVDTVPAEPVPPPRDSEPGARTSGSGQATAWRQKRAAGAGAALAEALAPCGGKRARVASGRTPQKAGAGTSYPLGRSPAKAAGTAAAAAVEAAAPALAPPEPQAQPAVAAPVRTTAAAECARTARLEREVEELRAQILMRERREAESAAAVHAKDVVRLQSELVSTENDYKQAARERDHYKRLLEETEERGRAAAARAREQTAEELRAQAAVFAREKESLLATLREKDSLISELEANQEALRAQSRRERSEWEAMSLQRSRHVEQLSLDLEISKQEAEKMQEHVANLSRRAERLQAQLEEEKAEHAASRRAAGEERDRLLAALQAQKSEAEVARSEGEALRKRAEGAEEAARAAQEELTQLRVKLAEVQGRAERHEEELGRLQQEHGKLRGEHGRALDTLRAQCAAWQQQLKLVKSGLAGMEAAGSAAFALAPG